MLKRLIKTILVPVFFMLIPVEMGLKFLYWIVTGRENWDMWFVQIIES